MDDQNVNKELVTENNFSTEDGEQVFQLWFAEEEEVCDQRRGEETEESRQDDMDTDAGYQAKESPEPVVRKYPPGIPPDLLEGLDDLEIDKDQKVLSSGEIWAEIWRWALIIMASIVFALLVNKYVLLNARIVSGSMENTIMTGDRVMGCRLSYMFSEPERGDIVIFESEESGGRILIKRIIGLPGETISYQNGQVYINGEPLEEDYLREPMLGTFETYVVPEGCYYLLGDNRNKSADSRLWQMPGIPKEDILGKALFVYWKGIRWLA